MEIVIRKPEPHDIPGLIALNDIFNGKGSTYESVKHSLENSANEMVTSVANTAGRRFYESCGYIGKDEMKFEKHLV